MLFRVRTHNVKYENLEKAKKLLINLDENFDTVKELDLSHNTYYPPVFINIVKICNNMFKLKKINCESILSCLTLDDMIAICKAMHKHLPRTIKHLNMSANALSCNIPDEFVSFIGECNDLEHLNLYNCGLGHEGIVKILKGLEGKCPKLNYLNIGKNRINILNSELGKIINGFKELKTFRMAHNTVSEGFDEFLNELTQNFTELDITDNFIEESDGLRKVIEGSELKELHIRDIKTDDMSAILDAILIHRKLEILDIAQNDMFEEGDLLKIIKIVENNQLKKLFIYDNFYETEFITQYDTLRDKMLYRGKFIDDDPALLEEVIYEKLSRI